ncbi:hypothetical protein DOS84_18685 [Flavobacterium aquariorum]|uniref:Uncharacterized protein n=1 Tax=Flavobacterium aquariorum TaxID=2217670 RepID=A0A2W7U3M2_9FLAO|nr:hypothetical protein [Flavobacterium aquariorum]PZX91849.1 hypothetical protein DOS84_18685 [Flavobacterium aquariorum]
MEDLTDTEFSEFQKLLINALQQQKEILTVPDLIKVLNILRRADPSELVFIILQINNGQISPLLKIKAYICLVKKRINVFKSL